MNDHLWTQDHLEAFLAGGLDAAERERFELHIRDCTKCFTALEAARAFDTGLANLFASVRPSPLLEDRTVRALPASVTVVQRRSRIWGRRALMGLAATLIIGAFGAVTSLVIANGGLPMPGENFVWNRGDESETSSRESLLERESIASAAIATPAEMAEQLNHFQSKFTRDLQSRTEFDANRPVSEFTTNFTDSTATTYSKVPQKEDQRRKLNQNDWMRFDYSPPVNGTANSLRMYYENSNGKNLGYAVPPTDGAALLGGAMGGGGAGRGGEPRFGNGDAGLGAPSGGGLGAPSGGPGRDSGGAPGGPFLGAIDAKKSGDVKFNLGQALPGLASSSGPVAFGTTATPQNSTLYFNPSATFEQSGQGVAGKDQSPVGEEAGKARNRLSDRAEKESAEGGQGQPPQGSSPQSRGTTAAPAAQPPAEQQAVRKIIIRSGDIEFEVDSFDSAVATVTLLVTKIPNAYVGTVNSEKLANGKVKGSIVVRVPPDSLDGLVLEMRKELGKTGELKGQRIGSQDITKMYTDIESRLKAARAMETRLLEIIKTGKGEIKQLLEAEKELGNWRTKIEEYEGEIRYYSNLASLSTLTITLAEKEIRKAAGITESERVQAGIEVEDVDKAFREAMAAVLEAKGRVTKSELKQLAAGQFNAILNFEVAPDASGPLRDRLKQLGRVARLEIDRVQTADGGPPTKDAKITRGDAVFQVQFYNLANVAPRETAVVQVAAPDVAASFRTLRDAVEKAKGRVLTASVTEGEAINVTAQFDFEVKRTEEAVLQAALAASGDVIARTISRAPESDSVTDSKVLFRTTIFNAAKIPARETVILQLSVADIPKTFGSLQAAAEKAGARIVTAQLHDDNGNQLTQLDFELKRGAEAPLLTLFDTTGDTVYRNVLRASENTQSTDTKVLYRLSLLDSAKMQPRETTTIQYAVLDIPSGFRSLKDVVQKAKGRVVNSQLNENDNLNITAQLDFEVKTGEDAAVLAALNADGDILGRQTTRQAESRLVSDTKVLYRVTFANANRLKPRETTTLAIEVSDVDATAAVYTSLVKEAKGRVVDSNIANDRSGRITAKLIYDVPLASAAGIVEKAKSAGTVRVQQSNRDPSATDGKFATARLDIVISNTELIIPKDDGVWPQIRKGLATSASALLSSLSWVIVGLCVVLPWMVVGYFGYRLVRRATKRTATATTATTTA